MRIRPVHTLSLALAMFTLAPTARAQSAEATSSAPVTPAAPGVSLPSDAPVPATEVTGPRRSAAVAGIQVQVASDAPAPMPMQAKKGRTSLDVTLVIVGAAAFVGGLMIGDNAGNAIAVVGLGVGLIGLYNWLR